MELHSWNLTYKEAIELQKKLRGLITIENLSPDIDIIAGADVAYDNDNNSCIAACVIYSIKERKVIEEAYARQRINFPYIPGLLSFREVPVILEAFKRIRTDYDAALLDGQGFAHPRRFGLASHTGLWLGKPTIGCAKTKLIGTYSMPANNKGSFTFLYDNNEVIGAVVRTKKDVKPVFISIGTKVNLADAISTVMKCTTKYRIPEPIRYAHNLVNKLKRK
jgi:deoxyribonuclease V